MTNTKTTKRSLLASVMALFLCFTMLLGTTFAWFTDSVTSANNIIKAGNLDIELYHSDKAVTDEKVGESTKLFDEVALWEPGVMVWEELTVKNEGDLALKYQLTLNVLEATKIDGVSFASMLKVALVDDGFEYTRENVEAIAADEWQDLATFTLADKLDKTENEVYGIVIWWQPSDNDNLFNMNNGNKGKEVSVQVGVTLLATQLEAENDAFGNDYDEDAWVEGYKVYSAEDLQTAINNGETEITLMADMQLEEPIEIPAPAVATYSARNAVVIDLNGKTITAAYNESTDKHAYAIDNYGNLILNGGTIEARGIYNQEGATITVNGTKIVNLDMNGGSCIWGYGGAIYLNDATLIGYTGCVYSKGYLEINGGTYTCYSAVTNDGEQISPTYNIRSYGDLVINDGDFTSRHGLLAIAGDAEINGGTYTMTSIGVITSHVFYVFADSSNVVVNGGTFNCDLRTAQNNGSSMICVDAANTTINVYGGTFNLTPAKYVVDGYKAVETDGKYVVVSNTVKDENVVDTAAELATAIANGGEVVLAADIDMNNAWASVVPANGLIILGNGKTITNLNQPLLAGKGGPVVTVKGLTIADSNVGIAANENGLGTGAFLSFADYSGDVVFEDCHLLNSTVTGNERAAAFVGYSQAEVTIKDCSVEGCTIQAVGSTAALIGHASKATVIENTSVTNTKVTATEDRTDKAALAGSLIGTVAGNTTLTNVTTSNNTVSNNGATPVSAEIGRIVSASLTIDGAVVVTDSEKLQAAINSGVGSILLGEGEFTADLYVVPANRNLTITGQGAATKLNFKNGQVRLEQFDSLTISNCTIGRMVDKKWGQLVFSTSNNAGGIYTISDCIFDGVGTQGVYINENTSGAIYNIKNCTFNGDFGDEGAITIQNNEGVDVTVNVTECDFNNVTETSHEIFLIYASNTDGWTLNAEGVEVSGK